MHKMLTALLLGATLATPVLAQERRPDDGRRYEGLSDGNVRTDRVGGEDRRYDQRDEARRDDPRRNDDSRFDGRDGRDGRQDGRQDGRWDRDRGDRGGNDRGNGYGRNDRYGQGYGGQGYGQNYGNQGRNGGWNRGWRGDNRYDWQSYRRGNDRLFRAPRYAGPRGYDRGYSRWSQGYRIAPAYYGRSYWIQPDRYRLPPAYGSYRWVRYYDDVALVDVRSGLIQDILYSFFL